MSVKITPATKGSCGKPTWCNSIQYCTDINVATNYQWNNLSSCLNRSNTWNCVKMHTEWLAFESPCWTQTHQETVTLEFNVLMWGVYVILPKKLWNQVLQEIHSSYPGVSRMKHTTKNYILHIGKVWLEEHLVDLLFSSIWLKNLANE